MTKWRPPRASYRGRDKTLTETLREKILTASPEDIVSEYVLERLPHIFEGDWTQFRSWRSQLAESLDVDACELVLVGSACVGCSLNPSKGLRPFSENSDIDAAIVSERYFEESWMALRRLRLSSTFNNKERTAISSHKQNYVYHGTIAADRVLRFLPFGRQWMRALAKIRTVPPTDGRKVGFRIYKDFESLREYHVRSVGVLRAKLMEES